MSTSSWFKSSSFVQAATPINTDKKIIKAAANSKTEKEPNKFTTALSNVWSNVTKWFTRPGDVAVDTSIKTTDAGVKISDNIAKTRDNLIGGLLSPFVIPLILAGVVGLIVLMILRKF